MKRILTAMVFLNAVLVAALVLSYLKWHSFIPLYIGVMPLVLSNYILVREFVRPVVKKAEGLPPSSKSARRKAFLSLFLMPIGFCIALPDLIEFDSSLGWPPVVCFGFSVLLCIVIIALYGGIKTALRKNGA